MLKYIESANPYELIDYLIETYPVSDRPFLAPWIVVPNREFQEWIDREIAKKVGSSPHFNYVFPIEFIWKLYRLIEPDLPKKLPTDLHALSFKIFELLANNEQVKLLFGDLQDQSHRFALAVQLADVFDQYINVRPHMLFEWEDSLSDSNFGIDSVSAATKHSVSQSNVHPNASPHAQNLDILDGKKTPELIGSPKRLAGYIQFQKELWQSLNSVFDRGNNLQWSRTQIYKDWLRQLKNPDIEEKLPADIFFVGERDWNRLLVESVELISRHTNVHVVNYPELENDISPKTQQDLNRMLSEPKQIGFSFGSRQNFISHLAEKWRENGVFSPYLLALRRNSTPSQTANVVPKDHWFKLSNILSIPGSIHACHSIKREVEVLKDDLLHFLNTSEAIDLSEIGILVPDVEAYSPIIKQVFAQEPILPVYLFDGQERPLQDSFLALLDLAYNDCKMSDLMDTLTDPNIMDRYGFDESELGTIRDWIVSDNIHFGLVHSHRYSLSTALTSWWRGYFVEHRSFTHQPEISPSIRVRNSDQLSTLSKLQMLYDEMLDLVVSPETERLNTEWLAILQEYFVRIFKDSAGSNPRGYNWVIHWFEQLSEELAYASTSVSYEVFMDWFRSVLVQKQDHSSSFGTGVLVSSYIPNRLLPFSYTAMLGLNEREFPGNPQRPVFDLIHQQPLEGERQRKKDTSRLFIERLALTKSQYFLSYIGRDAHTNSEKNPSPLITQLRYLHKGTESNQKGKTVSPENSNYAALTFQEHRLHAFAKPYFSQKEGKNSFNKEHYQQCCSLYGDLEPSKHTFFVDTTLVLNGSHSAVTATMETKSGGRSKIDLDDLIRFYTHPTRFYLETTLHVQDSYDPLVVQDYESYMVEGLDKYEVKLSIWEALEEGVRCKECYEYLRSIKVVPPHSTYYPVFEELFDQLQQFYSLVNVSIQSLESRSLALSTHTHILEAQLPILSSGEFKEYRLGRLQAKHKVGFFVKHLLKVATGSQEGSDYYYIDKKNWALYLAPIRPELAQQQLEQLIHWYVHAMQSKESLIFFPESSLSYVEALHKKGDELYALEKAMSAWKQKNKSYGYPGEGEDLWNNISWFDEDPLATQAFQDNSHTFWANWMDNATKKVLEG
jgi:exodeoxyribonuclease V gamma subunit